MTRDGKDSGRQGSSAPSGFGTSLPCAKPATTMFGSRLMLLSALALSAVGCVRDNADHCVHREQDLTCRQEHPDLPYCSRCEANNDGCVAAPEEDPRCWLEEEPADDAGSVTPDTGNTGTHGTSTLASAGTASESGTSTSDGSTAETATANGNEEATQSSTEGTISGDATTSTEDTTTVTGNTTDPTDSGGATSGSQDADGSTSEVAEASSTDDTTGTVESSSEAGEVSTTETDPPTECGNGVVDPPQEECDGGLGTGPRTCEDLELGTGPLYCGDDCLYDTSQCEQPPDCGNGIREEGEACDGEVDDLTCTQISDDYIAGELGCTDDCRLDPSLCISCRTLLETCDVTLPCCEGLGCSLGVCAV